MSTWRHLFTVLTPTYNRAHTLERVYASLREQSFQEFEWVVVDDGSTDNTQALVRAWEQEASFPIHYFWQENGHKKTAFNRGVKEASGQLIVALDSDDSLDVNALYAMAQAWSAIAPDEQSKFVAVTGLCERPGGRIVGDMFPQDVFDATALDMTFKYHIKGEKFGCMRTDVLRQFPFPENIQGFVPESLVWRAIARAGYLTRFVNQVFRMYYDSPDSLSVQGKTSAQHALGLFLLAQDTVVHCLHWFRYQPSAFFMAAARYTRFGLHLKRAHIRPPPDRRLKGMAAWLLVASMWPVGLALYLRDRVRQGRSAAVGAGR